MPNAFSRRPAQSDRPKRSTSRSALGLPTIIGGSLLLTSCTTDTILVDGQAIGRRTSDGAVRGEPLTTDLENPLITGVVRVRGLHVTPLADGSFETCCSRTFLQASHRVFIPGHDHAFLSITTASRGLLGDSHRYGVPPIALTHEAGPVRLGLSVDGVERVSGSVALASDVLVLPVHVHVITASNDPPNPGLSEHAVREWFDPPNVRLLVASSSHPVTRELTTITKTYARRPPAPLYPPVDLVWRPARIQFRLASYEHIQDRTLAEDIVGSNEFAFEPTNVHVARAHVSGIHVYVGRSASGNLRAGRTRGPECSNSTSRNHAIAVAWNRAGDVPMALAHELGHFLGLSHVDEPELRACGQDLLDPDTGPSGNLMRRTPGSTGHLSERQIERARAMARRYLEAWGL